MRLGVFNEDWQDFKDAVNHKKWDDGLDNNHGGCEKAAGSGIEPLNGGAGEVVRDKHEVAVHKSIKDESDSREDDNYTGVRFEITEF